MWLFLLWLFPGTEFDAGRYEELPDWAQVACFKLETATRPGGADVWRLSEQLEINLDEKGNLVRRHRVVDLVLRQGGAERAGQYAVSGSSDGGKLLRIRGWHLPAHGRLDKLDKNKLVVLGASDGANFFDDSVAVAFFKHVAKGSVVAFESIYREKSFLGPVTSASPATPYPTLEYRLSFPGANNKPETFLLGFEQWGLQFTKDITGDLVLENLPGLADEAEPAPYGHLYPRILVRYPESGDTADRYRSWDHFARWYWDVFKKAAYEGKAPETGRVNKKKLMELSAAVTERITYRQVYLSNARGYEPLSGAEVIRRAYGDCKDMVACYAHLAQKKKVLAYPALANIVDGAFITAEDVPFPSFNHLIAAVPLTESKGLPAEVVVDGQRYLLFDGTSNKTRFGWLPSGYEGRQVLICTPRGAVWAPIPQSAIEPASLTFKLAGKLNDHNDLSGRLDVLEEGNAAGFRYYMGGDKEYVERLLRMRLDLPATVDLEMLQRNHENGNTSQSWKIEWPGFLRRDGNGFRLPACIVPEMDTVLTKPGRKRRNPIAFEGSPQTTWEIELTGTTQLLPGGAEAGGKSTLGEYTWKAQGGDNLKVGFSRRFPRVIYTRPEIAEGMTAWRTFKKDFRRFRQNQTLLRVP
ncbi:MAG: DUF3857 domain-containing protein [Acidobacteriota bacterium]|nr:DUF3857 domain-containing protein [Acidobacteriota bacterium]